MRRVLAILFAAAFIAAAGDPPPPKPLVPVPDKFHHQPAGAAPDLPSEWWKEFRDPLLDWLIEPAVRPNREMRIAAARIAEARALRGGSKSALLPSIDGTVSATQLRGGFNQGVVRIPGSGGAAPSGNLVSPFETSIVSGGFTSRWEIDLFGGRRKELR